MTERPRNPEEESAIMLDALKMELNREIPNGYRRCIDEAKKGLYFVTRDTPYSPEMNTDMWEDGGADGPSGDPIDGEKLSGFGRDLREAVSGGVVVDLGNGSKSAMRQWSLAFKAKRYIGIDIGEREGARHEINTEAYQLQLDILEALSRMPDESVDVVYSAGLERNDVYPEQTNNYEINVSLEIDRVLKPGGKIVRTLSDFVNARFVCLGYRQLHPENPPPKEKRRRYPGRSEMWEKPVQNDEMPQG